ncbi:MAG: hypothetical protein DMG43_13585 [Acidobacteria bacterium]|nr:MAG: hypothetical protein DMG43_13585 [Acidobacteriota bacterium]
MDAWTISGTVASFAGLGVGFWTLVTAQGAKEAAQQAARRATLHDLTEELQRAHQKMGEIGIFLMGKEWRAAYHAGNEVQSACTSVSVRWSGTLTENALNDLLTAGQLAQSIAKVAQILQIWPESPKKMREKAGVTHLRASGLISGVLAEAKQISEKDDV